MTLLYRVVISYLIVFPSLLFASGIDDLMSASSIWKMLLSLAFVIALIPLSLLAMKKIQKVQGKLGNMPIQIVNVQALGAKEKLVVIEVDQQKLLLGVTGHSISLIKTLSEKKVEFSDYINTQDNTPKKAKDTAE